MVTYVLEGCVCAYVYVTSVGLELQVAVTGGYVLEGCCCVNLVSLCQQNEALSEDYQLFPLSASCQMSPLSASCQLAPLSTSCFRNLSVDILEKLRCEGDHYN